ncbi:hypothetical protein [Butyrivibrio sp. WCD3002]|uniref:hypothetical protein n=1 Tax=Butyrivibrio sp. WCD3002 TaxID=1280676 RepID=UPI0012DBF326|nr:hypothetical protein [Butyrivibrio sp. WCD3002]
MMMKRKYKSIIKNLVSFAVLLLLICSNGLTATATVTEATAEGLEQGDAAEEGFSPKQAWIDLSEYSIENGLLSPGEENVLSLKIKNLSKLSAARGVSISISNDTGAVYPAYGTDNQVYVGRIEPEAEQTVQIPLMVSAELSEDKVSLKVSVSFVSNDSQYDNSFSIVIPARGEATIRVRSLEVNQSAIIGKKSLLSITMYNNGQKDVSDARLVITGNVSEDSKNIKLDTLSALMSHSEDGQISFTESGEQTIDVKLVYSYNGITTEQNIGSYVVSVKQDTGVSENDYVFDPVIKSVGKMVAALFVAVAGILLCIYIVKHD